MKNTIGFLQEINQGQIKWSLIRLMSLICCLNAVILSNIVYYQNDKLEWYDLLLILLFLCGAFAPKVFQKFAESKFIEK